MNDVNKNINRVTLSKLSRDTFGKVIIFGCRLQMKEIEKSKVHTLIEISEYVPNSVVSKTVIRKSTGNICIVAIDTGEVLAEKISPFDTFIQIIEGTAEVVIDDQPNVLQMGQGIIIPAHTSNIVRANGRSKMISTVIKSGYEGIVLQY